MGKLLLQDHEDTCGTQLDINNKSDVQSQKSSPSLSGLPIWPVKPFWPIFTHLLYN